MSTDRSGLREIQRELTCRIDDAKNTYKNKVDGMFKSRNSKDALKGIKQLSGCLSKTCMPEPDDVNTYVEDLKFSARFDVWLTYPFCPTLISNQAMAQGKVASEQTALNTFFTNILTRWL